MGSYFWVIFEEVFRRIHAPLHHVWNCCPVKIYGDFSVFVKTNCTIRIVIAVSEILDLTCAIRVALMYLEWIDLVDVLQTSLNE